VETLQEIASLQAAAGEREAAGATIAAAHEIARNIKSVSWQSHALSVLSRLQARIGLGEDAVRTAAAIRSDRDEHWPEIAAALAKAGDREAFKRLLIPAARYPNAACKLCLLLPRLYPEQRAEVEGLIGSGGVR
jgi:hypothetical protein